VQTVPMLNILGMQDEFNKALQNCHTVNTAKFLALVERLAEKGLLDEDDQIMIQKRETYWISQIDQMVAQNKEEAIKAAVEDFKKKQAKEHPDV
jgi:hypothetical protein